MSVNEDGDVYLHPYSMELPSSLNIMRYPYVTFIYLCNIHKDNDDFHTVKVSDILSGEEITSDGYRWNSYGNMFVEVIDNVYYYINSFSITDVCDEETFDYYMQTSESDGVMFKYAVYQQIYDHEFDDLQPKQDEKWYMWKMVNNDKMYLGCYDIIYINQYIEKIISEYSNITLLESTNEKVLMFGICPILMFNKVLKQ